MVVRFVLGDITTFTGGALVNAANPSLLGGGGVDGAIHRAAGQGLRNLCLFIPEKEPGVRCRVGEVKPTPALRIKCDWILHTVGPIWDLQRAGALRPGEDVSGSLTNEEKEKLLGDCYHNALDMAELLGAQSIAFPAISTGVYGCPQEVCARVALEAVKWDRNDLSRLQRYMDVHFYLYGDPTAFPIWVRTYREVFGEEYPLED